MEVNILAVFLAAIASMVIGMIRYHPKLFGTKYKKLVSVKGTKKDMNKVHIVAFLSMFVFAFVLSLVYSFYSKMTALFGAIQGLMFGLGFVATIMMVDYAYASRNSNLYLINAGYYLVTIIVMGTIIGAM